MNGYILVLSATLIAFTFLMAALFVVQRFGKVRSRCACRRSEDVLKRYDAVHRTADPSRVYDSAKVDPASLPIVSE